MSMPSIRIEPLRDARAVDEIVHAIEATQQRGFAAPRRSDEGGDGPRGNAQVHVVQDLVRAVLEIELLDLDHAALDLRFLQSALAGWR